MGLSYDCWIICNVNLVCAIFFFFSLFVMMPSRYWYDERQLWPTNKFVLSVI